MEFEDESTFNRELGKHYFQCAANQGEPKGHLYLARLQRGLYHSTTQYALQAAKMGDIESMFRLGRFYAREEEYEDARHWLKMAIAREREGDFYSRWAKVELAKITSENIAKKDRLEYEQAPQKFSDDWKQYKKDCEAYSKACKGHNLKRGSINGAIWGYAPQQCYGAAQNHNRASITRSIKSNYENEGSQLESKKAELDRRNKELAERKAVLIQEGRLCS